MNIKKNDYANILGYSFFEVETGSMENTIEIGDFIIVKLDNNNISNNDIITYKSNLSFITHRIIKIDENEIITKGDNNNSEDEPIKKENVIGKVVYIIKDIKIWKSVFSDFKVILSISTTVILIIINILFDDKKDDKKADKKDDKKDDKKTDKKDKTKE
jgi:signal peptidase